MCSQMNDFYTRFCKRKSFSSNNILCSCQIKRKELKLKHKVHSEACIRQWLTKHKQPMYIVCGNTTVCIPMYGYIQQLYSFLSKPSFIIKLLNKCNVDWRRDSLNVVSGQNGCKQIAEFLILSRSYIVCKLYWLLSYHKGQIQINPLCSLSFSYLIISFVSCEAFCTNKVIVCRYCHSTKTSWKSFSFIK